MEEASTSTLSQMAEQHSIDQASVDGEVSVGGLIGEVDCLLSDPFTDELDTTLDSIAFDDPFPTSLLNSPLRTTPATSPQRTSCNNSVVDDASTSAGGAKGDEGPQSTTGAPSSPAKQTSNSSLHSLGLPGNELEEVDWRDDAHDLRYRKQVLFQIVKILHARRKNPTTEWLRSLPTKSRKLEDYLYKGAPSLDEYRDKRTLKHRLKKVARALTAKHRAVSRKSKRSHADVTTTASSSANNSDDTSSPPTKRARSTTSPSSDELHSVRHGRVHEQAVLASHRRRQQQQSLLASELVSLQAIVNERERQHWTPLRRPSASMVTPSSAIKSSLAKQQQQPSSSMNRRGSGGGIAGANGIAPRNLSASPSYAAAASADQLVASALHARIEDSRQYIDSSSLLAGLSTEDLIRLMNRAEENIRRRARGRGGAAASTTSSAQSSHMIARRNALQTSSAASTTTTTTEHHFQSSLGSSSSSGQEERQQGAGDKDHEARGHGTEGSSSLGEEQSTNQDLQDQILHNIRQQQQLMQDLKVGGKMPVHPGNPSSLRRNNNGRMPVMLNIANPSSSAAIQNMRKANGGAASPVMNGSNWTTRSGSSNHRRQLPMDLLHQTLARGGRSSAEVSLMMQHHQQRSSFPHLGILPPSSGANSSRRPSLEDHFSANDDNHW